MSDYYTLPEITKRRNAVLDEMNGIVDQLSKLVAPAAVGLMLIQAVRNHYAPTLRDLDTQERVVADWMTREEAR